MKKGLLGLSAFIFAAALVGCSADNDKNADNNDKSETTTIIGETTKDEVTTSDAATADTEETTNKKDKDDEKTENDITPLSLTDIAGTYYKNGHAYMGKRPDDIDELDEKLKADPITISEDGILHFNGKDYKLVDEGAKKESYIFSIEGSGFDISRFTQLNAYADKDYEGPCAFARITSHMTVNDVDHPYDSYVIFLKQAGSERSFGYISIDDGEAQEFSFDFDWDSDDDEGSVFSENNTTEE